MSSEKLDRILAEGLRIYKELEFSDIPAENEIDYNFSEKYIKNRNKTAKNLSRSYWKLINTTAKKVAVIIISLIIAFSSLMTVDALREKIINFVFKIYATFTVIEPEYKDKSNKIDKMFSIKTPNDFEGSLIECSDVMCLSYFTNVKKQSIMFTQRIEISHFTFDSENGELKEEIINDTPCLVCETNSDYFCYWEFDGYRFELVYPKELGREFMSEVVGNLIEVELD